MLTEVPIYMFFWQSNEARKQGKFIFESARERVASRGKNLTAEEICRIRLKEGIKKVDDWNKIELFPVPVTDWINDHPEYFKDRSEFKRDSDYLSHLATTVENTFCRPHLMRKGIPNIPKEGPEKHLGDMQEGISIVNNYLFGIDRPVHFKPKAKTTMPLLAFITDKHKGNLSEDFDRYLHGAAPGSGKTSDFIMATQLCTELTGKNVHLLATSKPDTRKDLCDDAAKGSNFTNIRVVVPDKVMPDVQHFKNTISFSQFARTDLNSEFFSETERDEDLIYIVSIGVQDARGKDSAGNLGAKHKEFLETQSFGLYGKDEVHTDQGANSIFYKGVEDYLDYWLSIWMTGTPENILLEGMDFPSEENRNLFTANKLTEAMLEGDPDWQGYPIRNYFVNDYAKTQEIVSKQLSLEEAQNWTLKKQWAWDSDSGTFVHENVLRELFKVRFGVGLFMDDPRCFWGPGSGLSKSKRKTGILTISNGDTSVKTKHLAKMIEEITQASEFPFKAFSAHEPNGFDKWLSYCNSDDAGNSLFISHDKDMTGKNNPWINFQWISMEMGSITRMGQHEGRANRRHPDKTDVFYFFDDPDTAVACKFDLVQAEAESGDPEEVAEKIYRLSPFWMEGSEKWHRMSLPDLVDKINKLDPVGARGLTSMRHIRSDLNCPDSLLGMLKTIKMNKTISENISEVEGDRGKNQKPKLTEEEKKARDEAKLYRAHLSASIMALGKAVIHTHEHPDGEYYTVRDILTNPVLEYEGEVRTLEEICKPKLSFAHLEYAFDEAEINETTVNKSLSIIKRRLETSEDDLEARFAFVGCGDFNNSDTQFVPESFDLITDYVYNISVNADIDWPSDTFVDLSAGRGAVLLALLEYGAQPENLYYNDADPVMVHHFRITNKKFGLGIPEVNIFNYDASRQKKGSKILPSEFEENVDMEFDWGVGNPPYNESVKPTGNGTGGNVNLYKNISDAYPVKKGKALITPKGMIRHLVADTEFNTVYMNLMTEKDYWKYNTCFWVALKEENDGVIEASDKAISKCIMVGSDNPQWWELNGEPNKNMINYTGSDGIDAVVALPTAKTSEVYKKVNPEWGKILRGPKFCGTLLENEKSYLVTDDPVCAKFGGAVSCNTLEEAHKIELFVRNSDILVALNKRLKIKGKFWTMRHVKPFDPNQIVTGKEIPVEWDLTKEDLEYLGITND